MAERPDVGPPGERTLDKVLPAALVAARVALIALLILLIIRPPLGRPAAAADVSVRREMTPPTTAELERLAGSRTRVYAALPSPAPALALTPPQGAREGRGAAIEWTLRDAPARASTLHLSDDAGPLDSAQVTTDARGFATGAFRVRPARAGWHSWTVSAGDGPVGHTTAWVRPAEPLDVLVAAGSPSWEARDVARALEAAGARVTLAAPLAPGLTAGDAPARLPTSAGALAGYDAVVVTPDVVVDAAQRDALLAFAALGGGVVATGAAAISLPLVTATGPRARLAAAEIRWTSPAEIPPLPSMEVEPLAVSLSANPGAVTAAATGDGPLLLLTAHGRGRLAALGLEETGAWALQGGQGEALAAFWSGLASWVAGGARDAFRVELDPATAAAGALVNVRVERLDPTAERTSALELMHPDGREERLALTWTGDRAHARFLADEPGVFAIASPATEATASDARTRVLAAHHATPEDVTPADAWARLALLASASGGAALPADALEARLAPHDPAPGRRSIPPVLWLALALLLAAADWTARRLRGMV